MALDNNDDGDDDEASWIYVLPEFDLYLMDEISNYPLKFQWLIDWNAEIFFRALQ